MYLCYSKDTYASFAVFTVMLLFNAYVCDTRHFCSCRITCATQDHSAARMLLQGWYWRPTPFCQYVCITLSVNCCEISHHSSELTLISELAESLVQQSITTCLSQFNGRKYLHCVTFICWVSTWLSSVVYSIFFWVLIFEHCSVGCISYLPWQPTLRTTRAQETWPFKPTVSWTVLRILSTFVCTILGRINRHHCDCICYLRHPPNTIGLASTVFL